MKTRESMILTWTLIAMLVGLAACSTLSSPTPVQPAPKPPTFTVEAGPTNPPPTVARTSATIEYRNTEFGFTFTLPASWEGYSIVPQSWEGINAGLSGDQVIDQGPIVAIRHPAWTSTNPRQDIPIMVFTLAQWDALSQDKFHIGAAPIGPSELGRNARFVFALPARYNYAFPTGFEEVESILTGQPLHPF